MAISEELKIILRAQNETTAAFSALNKNLNDLKATALKVGSVLVGALAIRDVIDQTKEWSEEVRRVQSVTGLAATEASRLAAAARIVGIDTEELNTSLGRLAKNMFSNTVEADKGKDAFAKWHIQVLEQSGAFRNINDVLLDVAETIRLLGDSAASRALELDLFGRSGGRLHELLLRGAAGVRELETEADALGVTLGSVSAKQLQGFREDTNRFDLAMLGLKVTLGTALLPILTQFVTALTQFVSHISAAIGHSREFAMIVKVLGDAFGGLLSILKQVLDRLGKFIQDIKLLGLGGALGALLGDIIAKVKEFLPKVGEELDKLGPIGWVVKFLLLAATLELAADFALTLSRAIIGMLLSLPGVQSGAALGIPAAPLAITVGTVLVLAVVASQIENQLAGDVTKDVREKAEEAARLIVVTAGIAATAAAAAAFGLPVALAVAAGLLIAITVVEFGAVAESITRNLGSDFGSWILNNIVPHLPFPVSFIGGLLKVSIPMAIEWITSRAAPASGAIIAPPGPFYPPHGGLAGPTVDLSPLSRVPAGSEYLASDAAGNPIYRTPGGVIVNTGAIGGVGPFGMAEGGAGVATRPTFFLAGERGPEPFAFGRAAGGNVINIYVSGNITQSEDELARRVGAAVMDRLKSFRSLAY